MDDSMEDSKSDNMEEALVGGNCDVRAENEMNDEGVRPNAKEKSIVERIQVQATDSLEVIADTQLRRLLSI